MADTRISPTCEHAEEWDRENKTVARFCGRPTRYWYPAMGGGTAALCEQHGAHLRPYVRDYPEDANV